VLEIIDVAQTYPSRAGSPPVLTGVSLRLRPGEAAAVVGPAGSGKSTLMRVAGGIDRPSAGSVQIEGDDLARLGERRRAALRSERVGFVCAHHALLPHCTLLENALTPVYAGPPTDEPDEALIARARALLERVGLGGRLDHRPGDLSSAGRQRAALARALIRRPALVLCDEPAGCLDGRDATDLASLVVELQAADRFMLIVATRDEGLAARLPATYRLVHGALVREPRVK
jgi:lipoprotein-releasing system ATP-binding protein